MLQSVWCYSCDPLYHGDTRGGGSTEICLFHYSWETLTTSELSSMYLAASGTVSRRQFISTATTSFGEKMLVLHVEGCKSTVGFYDNFRQFLKIVKISTNQDDDDNTEKLVRKIKKEVMAKCRPQDYNLDDFVHYKVFESTSETLLKFLALYQEAQSLNHHCLCNGYRNQTTLGLPVKLHHNMAAQSLIRLNEQGITSTYDEAQCCYLSVA